MEVLGNLFFYAFKQLLIAYRSCIKSVPVFSSKKNVAKKLYVTVITDVEASGAVPPGTYTPTRSIGEKNSPALPPRGVFIVQGLRKEAFENFMTRE